MYSTVPRIIRRREPVYMITDQCDCACSATIASQTRQLVIPLSGKMSTSPHLHSLALPKSHRVAFVPSGNGAGDSIAVLNKPAWEILSSFEQPRHWKTYIPIWYQTWGEQAINTTLAEFFSLGFLVVPNTLSTSLVEQPRALSVWLHITDRCNLSCAYCYLPHTHSDMSTEIGRAAIEATFRSALTHNYRQVKLKYAGGEPLFCFPLITKLHHYAQTLANQHGLSLDGVVLSNGTLVTPEIVQKMKSLGLRLMVSLDGLDDFHDCQRFYTDGRGSAADTIFAVELALDHGLVPDISITVSGRNAGGLPELIAWVLEHDLPFSLNFYRENDLSVSQADLELDEEKIVAGMLAAYKVIQANLPHRSLLASLVDRANLSAPHLRTCGVGHSYLVFDCRGQVSKCQMQIEKPVTNVHADDPLTLVRTDKIGIQNIPVDEKERCRSCEWKYWCMGGCPLDTYRATGQYDVKSPNCNIYKALYPETVRLEGLRLLKLYGRG